MSDNTWRYQLAQARVEAARQAYNYAAANLDREEVRCRFAELCCQHEPAASILSKVECHTVPREALIQAARFVLVGRLGQ